MKMKIALGCKLLPLAVMASLLILAIQAVGAFDCSGRHRLVIVSRLRHGSRKPTIARQRQLQSTCNGEDTFLEEVSYNTTAPPFPPAAYHLARDEDAIEHNFISFIDHFNEPYSQVSRLVEPRLYARSEQFTPEAMDKDPTVDDIACPPSHFGPLANFLSWNRLPARIVVGTMAYIAFPMLVDFLESATLLDVQQSVSENNDFMTGLLAKVAPKKIEVLPQLERDNLSTLVGIYLPGVSIVLGTYFSMTLSILYDRFQRLQQTMSMEASMLAYCFQVLLDLFARDETNLVTSVQCVADQISTMVRDSRGKETMRIIYKDPYAGILGIVQQYNRKPGACREQDAVLVGVIRDCVKQLFQLRSKRMNDETLALAPMHFDVMTFLSGLLLAGIALGTVATAQTDGVPTEVSRILFSTLVVCFTTIYEMSYDLNRPFDGIYQLRRSGAATHFLQMKYTISKHPVLKDKINLDPDRGKYDPEQVPKVDPVLKSEIWYN